MRRIVIIGGSAAGMMAAIAAAEESPDVEVTVVTQDRTPYRRPATPALIAGYITDPAEIRVFSPETLARHNIKLIYPAEATNIDPQNKIISIQRDDAEERLSYDAAVIATGGHPLMLSIAGADKKGVCSFTTYEGAAEIADRAMSARCAVVIGAGFIALEVAEALMHKGLDVYFNVRTRMLRKLLEPDVSEFLCHEFSRKGLKMLTGEEISEIGGEDRVEYVVHKGRKIATNLVVMGTGTKPNVGLAAGCGIKTGPGGAIKVDNRMQTSIENIYAAGDCAESPDLATGKSIYSPVGSIGASAGKIAGRNAAGANQKTKGFLRAQADEILGMQIYSIGHSSTTAKEVNLTVKVHNIDAHQLGQRSRTTKPFEIAKLLTDTNSRIIGAQLVAKKYGSQFARQLYVAVLHGLNKEEFLEQFNWPRIKLAEALLDAARSVVVVKSVGQGEALALATTPSHKKINQQSED
jgi:NADH oxidase (H2O2-forming)